MRTEENRKDRFELRSYTRKELCQKMNISLQVLALWIKPYRKEWGITNRRYFTIKQVRLMVETFGIPGEIELS